MDIAFMKTALADYNWYIVLAHKSRESKKAVCLNMSFFSWMDWDIFWINLSADYLVNWFETNILQLSEIKFTVLDTSNARVVG